MVYTKKFWVQKTDTNYIESQSLHGYKLEVVTFYAELTQIIIICKDLHSKDLHPSTVFICHQKPENKSRI